MTNGINAPLGLEPMGTFSGASANFALSFPYLQIASGYASSLFIGAPVSLSASGNSGFIGIGATSSPLLGVFDGCVFTDTSNVINLGAGPAGISFWQAGTVLANNTIAIANIVGIDPNTYYSVQTNSASGVSNGTVGSNANFAGFGSGDTRTGLSTVTLDAGTIATTATLNAKIMGLNNNPSPSQGWALPYNNLIVTINNHVLRAGTGS